MVNTNEMIFGVRAVLEALEAGKEIDKILVKRDIQSELSRELFAALKGRTIPVVRVPVEKLNRITRKNHQGVIAYISAVEYAHVDTLVPTLYEEVFHEQFRKRQIHGMLFEFLSLHHGDLLCERVPC